MEQKQRPRIASQNVKQIDLSDGSWVKIKGSLDYASMAAFTKHLDIGDTDVYTKEDMKNSPTLKDVGISVGDPKVKDAGKAMMAAIELYKSVILAWNFINSDGKVIECKPEHIEEMDLETVQELMAPIMATYQPEKKSSTSSMPSSQKE